MHEMHFGSFVRFWTKSVRFWIRSQDFGKDLYNFGPARKILVFGFGGKLLRSSMHVRRVTMMMMTGEHDMTAAAASHR